MTHTKTNKAIFPGSFDPFHNGHLKVLKAMLPVYDEITVYVANNSSKQYNVDLQDRFNIAEKVVTSLGENNVKVVMQQPKETTPGYCKKNDITHVIRGLRETQTLTSYESTLSEWYLEENPNLEFHYVVVEESLSGTHIRNALKAGQSIKDFVIESVADEIIKFYDK